MVWTPNQKAVWLWRGRFLAYMLTAGVGTALTAGFLWLWHSSAAGFAVSAAGALALSALLFGFFYFPPREWAGRRYELTATSLEVCRGVWRKRRSAMPLSALRRITIYSGPFSTLLGLWGIKACTAAGNTALTGLSRRDAEALARLLEERLGSEAPHGF